MEIISDKTAKLREAQLTKLTEESNINFNNLEIFTERLAQLEFAIEDQGWERIGDQINKEFSRSGIAMINDAARLFWLKNPLIRRAVLTQANYVFGQGVNIASENKDVNEVIQSFLDDKKNKAELTSHQNQMVKEIELSLFANIFFVFFTDKLTGAVKVRTIPEQEMKLIITDPEDSKTPLYYKRVYNRKEFNTSSGDFSGSIQITKYYKDFRASELDLRKVVLPAEEAVIYHVSVNKLSDMQFGVSEIYAAIDWAKVYKSFLEDWVTITKSYAQFAWKMTSKNKTGMLRAKAKLNNTLSSDNTETNPPPATGGIFQGTGETKMDPIKTAGATTKADDGDKLVHMVSAATGIFYHYLVGDPSTGNLATAKSMERPMELQFKNRQQLWVDVYTNILNYAIDQSIIASAGKLTGARKKDDPDNIVLANGERMLSITFPDILEKDTKAHIEGILKAATLDGKPLAGTIEGKVVARMLLEALGESDIDEMIEKMFPGGEAVQPIAQQVKESFIQLKEILESQNGSK